MSDFAIRANLVKATLLEVAHQATQLGVGLQNAAPAEREGEQNPSVQYLLTTADQMITIAHEIEQLTHSHGHK